MLIIKVNKNSPTPVFQQIYLQIKSLIETGVLKVGDKLPSSRLLSEKLKVNRTTVYRAYEELWSFGYIESRPGSYSFVRQRAQLAIETKIAEEDQINWAQRANPNITSLLASCDHFNNSNPKPGIINFLPLSPDPSQMPTETFRKYLNKAMLLHGVDLLSYNNVKGYDPLRAFIKERMAFHGIRTTLDNILITNGTQNSLELFLKYVAVAGLKIIVEAPTYSAVIPLFEMYGAILLEVPITKKGIDLKILEHLLKNNEVAFLFTMPNFQNPTGITSTQAHREKLLELCKTYNTPIIEDGFEEEMKYFGKSVMPVKSMDNSGLVIYLGTFSKTLFPGLRLGWMVGNTDLINSLIQIKQITEISSNFLIQAAVYEFCQTGNYELHVKRLHRIYRKRMNTALKAAEKYLPKDKCFFTKPSGGYTFWISLANNRNNENEIVKQFEKNGVAVTPGKLFYVKQKEEASFRLSIAHLSEYQIEEGIRKIGIIIEKLN